ncbi:uncharacterized protein LOC118198649 [Stegodyphus dumicola]|uniref:uncharacterized protein LOC118198649 n=1 Tax=Stegodyphus dumicola TaxID=202533 RepID=UPI0015AB5DE2|nr:uncharacterized protein LOC118198649 [Stegodyphus dumicola]
MLKLAIVFCLFLVVIQVSCKHVTKDDSTHWKKWHSKTEESSTVSTRSFKTEYSSTKSHGKMPKSTSYPTLSTTKYQWKKKYSRKHTPTSYPSLTTTEHQWKKKYSQKRTSTNYPASFITEHEWKKKYSRKQSFSNYKPGFDWKKWLSNSYQSSYDFKDAFSFGSTFDWKKWLSNKYIPSNNNTKFDWKDKLLKTHRIPPEDSSSSGNHVDPENGLLKTHRLPIINSTSDESDWRNRLLDKLSPIDSSTTEEKFKLLKTHRLPSTNNAENYNWKAWLLKSHKWASTDSTSFITKVEKKKKHKSKHFTTTSNFTPTESTKDKETKSTRSVYDTEDTERNLQEMLADYEEILPRYQKYYFNDENRQPFLVGMPYHEKNRWFPKFNPQDSYNWMDSRKQWNYEANQPVNTHFNMQNWFPDTDEKDHSRISKNGKKFPARHISNSATKFDSKPDYMKRNKEKYFDWKKLLSSYIPKDTKYKDWQNALPHIHLHKNLDDAC